MVTPAMCLAGPRADRAEAVAGWFVGSRSSPRWEARRRSSSSPPSGGPERILTTLRRRRPAAGSAAVASTGCPDGSGIVYAAVDGDLWLQPIAGGAVRRITRHGPDGTCRSAGGQRRRRVRRLRRRPGRGVAMLARRRSPGRAPRRRFGRLRASTPPSRVTGRAACGRRGTCPTCRGTRPASSISRSTAQRGPRSTRSRRRRCGAADSQTCPTATVIAVRDDAGWLNLWVDDRPLVDEPFEHAGPTWGMGQRSFAVSPDGSGSRSHATSAGSAGCVWSTSRRGDVTRDRRAVCTASSRGSATVIAALRSGARTPTQVVVYDAATSDARTSLAGRPASRRGSDSSTLPEPELVEVEHDGVTLHARRYVAGAGRTLCWVHGGPTDQWQVEFMPRIAYWWAQGWDVLVPDPRGSTGHGRAYQQALRGEWGRLDVDDTAAMWRHSRRDRGWSRRSATVMIGQFVRRDHRARRARPAPRAGRGRRRAYPVTDLADLAARSHRFEAHYTDCARRPGRRASICYRERSPINLRRPHRRAPLLVLHGDADPVVPIEQSRRFVERMRAARRRRRVRRDGRRGSRLPRPENQLAEYRLTASSRQRVPVASSARRCGRPGAGRR